MSWLNLNDSLNSLKGQISNFANNVLADEDQRRDASSSDTELEELRTICNKQQQEISYLQKLNAELRHGRNASTPPKDDFNQSSEPWSWDLSDSQNGDHIKTEEIITDLNKKNSKLEKEKQELMSNLVLLDTEHQLNTEKLINMKNQLQKDYDELEDKYDKVREENVSLKKNKTEFNDVKSKEKSVESEVGINGYETCTKCEKLLEENRKFLSETETLKNETSILKSNNDTLQKVLDDCKNANDEEFTKMEEKLKLYESENKILVSELKKASQSITAFQKKSVIDADNCKKLAMILEGYEQQVSSLKEELLVKNSNETEELRSKLQQAIFEKEHTHAKYINILTENMKRYAECDKVQKGTRIFEETDPQILEFNHQVESILNILLDLKSKCESLEAELYNVTQEKTDILAEKNHEIEKLIQNSEILSQEVITKSQTIKDYESECNELIKNNEMLINDLKIFKNSSGLQTISESNEDNILLLESQLENANKKIEELEFLIAEREEKEAGGILEDFGDLKIVESENNKLKEDFQQVYEERGRLASALEKMKTELEITEYQYTEVNICMETLREEVENQKRRIEEISCEKLSLEKQNLELERNNEDVRSDLNVIREKLLLEEDTRKQYESQIRNLTEKLQNSKMSETSFKLQYDTVNKELLSLSEAKCAIEKSLKSSLYNLDRCKEELQELTEEKEKLKTALKELEEKTKKIEEERDLDHFQNVNLSENEPKKEEEMKILHESLLEEKNHLESEIIKLSSIKDEHENCHQSVINLEQKIKELEAAKNELTNVIITKHQESVTYHNEIQRLSQILNSEVEKGRNLELQLQTEKNSENPELRKKDDEIEKLTDQNAFLREKCEVMAQNLLEEQARVQQVLSEYSEKEQVVAKKLERLQTHLIEVEEHYTQELLRAEERNTELQGKVNEIQQREKNSSTMYTSVSIRANQHVETLQHQLQLITNQRDELRKKISDAEDHASKQEAALANLQFVLEQFQKDKEKDVQKETERIRRQIKEEKKVQENLRNEISGLQAQLEESKHGLLAASRLSDQLEQSKQLVTTLKMEVSQLREKLQKSEEQLQNLSSQSDGKVDKSLIKNLITGFVSTNNNLNKDQMQILKIIATVLDFNQQDHDKVNLSKAQQGWLGSFLSPQTSQSMSQESLSQAFVKFLENESKPRLVPSLLSSNGDTPISRKSSITAPRQSPSVLSEVVLPTFADFAQNRNSSSILKDVLKDNS